MFKKFCIYTIIFTSLCLFIQAQNQDIRKGGGSGSGVTVAAGTNVTMQTNGTIVTINSTDTNGFTLAAGTNIVVETNGSIYTVNAGTNAVSGVTVEAGENVIATTNGSIVTINAATNMIGGTNLNLSILNTSIITNSAYYGPYDAVSYLDATNVLIDLSACKNFLYVIITNHSTYIGVTNIPNVGRSIWLQVNSGTGGWTNTLFNTNVMAFSGGTPITVTTNADRIDNLGILVNYTGTNVSVFPTQNFIK